MVVATCPSTRENAEKAKVTSRVAKMVVMSRLLRVEESAVRSVSIAGASACRAARVIGCVREVTGARVRTRVASAALGRAPAQVACWRVRHDRAAYDLIGALPRSSERREFLSPGRQLLLSSGKLRVTRVQYDQYACQFGLNALTFRLGEWEFRWKGCVLRVRSCASRPCGFRPSRRRVVPPVSMSVPSVRIRVRALRVSVRSERVCVRSVGV